MKTQFTQAENRVLTEIYRRLNYFHNGDMNTKLLLLSMPSNAKALKERGFISPYGKEQNRCLSWYSLTDKGKCLFKNYITRHKLADDIALSIFEGKYVIQFNYPEVTND